MDSYGEAIDVDLMERGIDILDFFRGKYSWRRLMAIVDRLPRTSHFRAAMADDEGLAEELLKKQAEEDDEVRPVPSVPLQEYSREVELLTGAVELLQTLNGNVRAAAGDKNPPAVQRLPRPHTAIDRARDRAREERYHSLVAEVMDAQRRWAERGGEE